MPVRTEERINLIDYLSRNPTTESLLPDDIWAKFGVEYVAFDHGKKKKKDLSKADPSKTEPIKTEPIKLEPFKEDLSALEPPMKRPKLCKIMNHDCMWAGHCFSDEHPADEHPAFRLLSLNGSSIMRPFIKQETASWPAAQQSLLKPAVRAANAALPQTPPISDDDEEMKIQVGTTSVLRLLHDAIEDCDLDEDSDLCDYFEDREEEEVHVGVVEECQQEEEDEEERASSRSSMMRSCQFAAESDHSYHKGQAASPAEMLGIDTPSDSEEEIDVVSVVDKAHSSSSYNSYDNTNARAGFLPNSPSHRDQHQIQRRMVKAVSKKKPASSIKTILPVKKATIVSLPETSSGKRKSNDGRGVKRSKQYRINPPSKRRNFGHSSDSEPEPSEKRNLHNNMERQRRIDLRNAFEDLRVLVPEVSKKERAAKVVILREAAQYCDFLTNSSENHVKHCDDLKRQQEWLRHRVSQLRRNLAAKR